MEALKNATTAVINAAIANIDYINVCSDDEDLERVDTFAEDEGAPEDGDSEEGELGELTTYVKPVFKSGDNRARQSVSAEAFGNFNKKEDFKAPFY